MRQRVRFYHTTCFSSLGRGHSWRVPFVQVLVHRTCREKKHEHGLRAVVRIFQSVGRSVVEPSLTFFWSFFFLVPSCPSRSGRVARSHTSPRYTNTAAFIPLLGRLVSSLVLSCLVCQGAREGSGRGHSEGSSFV